MADIHCSAAAVELEHFEVSAVQQASVAADILADSPAAVVAVAQQVSAAQQVLVFDLAALALLVGDYLTDAVAAPA